MEPSIPQLFYTTTILIVLMFGARVAESVQKRLERRRVRKDIPLLNIALKSYERQIGKK